MDMKSLKKELQRKVAMANKRVKRLEQNNLTNLPAYKYYQQMKKGEKFTSAGKNFNELRKELRRVDAFLDAKTSKVREANKYLKGIAERTGIKYDKVSELPTKTKKFFELVSLAEQYLKNKQGSYHAIGYQKTWETVEEYVSEKGIDLNNEDLDMSQFLEELVEGAERGTSGGRFFNDIRGTEQEQARNEGWETLPSFKDMLKSNHDSSNWTKMPTSKDMLKGAMKLLGKIKK